MDISHNELQIIEPLDNNDESPLGSPVKKSVVQEQITKLNKLDPTTSGMSRGGRNYKKVERFGYG